MSKRKRGLGWPPLLRLPPEGAAARWERPELKAWLEPDEGLLWTDVAATGILGHPWVSHTLAWGSTFWDVAITDVRLLAVQLPFLKIFKRRWKTHSIRWSEVSSVEVRIITSTGAVLLGTTTPSSSLRFKLYYAGLDFAGITSAVRAAYPDVVVSSGLSPPASRQSREPGQR
jgi:hypothetical protein